MQVTVSRLRKALNAQDRPLTQPPGYVLRVSPGEYDRDAFESLAADARQALEQDEPQRAAVSFSQALQLWRGSPFADFLYETFLEAEIARLEEARFACLRGTDRGRSRSRPPRGARKQTRRAYQGASAPRGPTPSAHARAVPLRPRGGRAGRLSDGSKLLVEQVGLEPSAELRGLEQAILRQDAELAPPTSSAAAVDAPQREVSEPAPREAARKTVTILVSGDAALSQRGLDPELRRQLGDAFLGAATPVLKRHGAYVERLRDERVMGLFGIPSSHEDDALRAVRAAVELGEALARSGGAAPTGIETGEVFIGEPASSEPLVTGEVLDVAASLQQGATSGTILIGEATLRLVAPMRSRSGLSPGQPAARPSLHGISSSSCRRLQPSSVIWKRPWSGRRGSRTRAPSVRAPHPRATRTTWSRCLARRASGRPGWPGSLHASSRITPASTPAVASRTATESRTGR